jgi:hypothetical protein
MKFAYADPPYYKQGKRLYGDHPNSEIWDEKKGHLELITKLHDEYPQGWALSCNPADLAWILPFSPNLRVCAWTKTFHQIRPLCSIQYAWEPVLLHAGRKIQKRKPMVRDWLSCARAMKKGLVGAKPDAFNHWILDLIGWQIGDQLDDLFPGTNSLKKAIEERS